MNLVSNLSKDVFQLFFPSCCAICKGLLVSNEQAICIGCLMDLPLTGFHSNTLNPLRLQFQGRTTIEEVAACYYFNKGGKVQKLLHAIKYGGDQEAALAVGRLYGSELKTSALFSSCSFIIPIPVHASKLKQRGYNQAEVIAKGISESLSIPVKNDILFRTKKGSSQTDKDREARFQDLKGQYNILENCGLTGQRVLLVDDVITSGATMEACANLFISMGASVCAAALAWTSGE